MLTLNQYFDKIFCINLKRRVDRWEHVSEQCLKHNIELERFEAHEVLRSGKPHGNDGCTASHRALLEHIASIGWERVLIFEDDFKFRFDDSQQRFSDMIGEVPADFDILYLGAHYAGNPLKRISPHVIRVGRMSGTHAYAVTRTFAKEKAPYARCGPIDAVYANWSAEKNYYCFQPRLAIQMPGYSDIEEKKTNNTACGTSDFHERMV